MVYRNPRLDKINMDSKRKELTKYLDHEYSDPDEIDKILDPILNSVGYVVMHFNALEQSLNYFICNFLSVETDSLGLIVLHKMSYANKVDLFKRLSNDFHTTSGIQIADYENLILDLRECGTLRNLVIHADWENTNQDSYTYVNLKIAKDGIFQEYQQFSEKSLTEIILLIMNTRSKLYEYWDERNDILESS